MSAIWNEDSKRHKLQQKNDLRGNEILNRPIRLASGGFVGEDFPAAEDDDYDEVGEGEICRVRLELGGPWLVLIGHSLCMASRAEAKECNEDRNPGEERGDGCELGPASAFSDKD